MEGDFLGSEEIVILGKETEVYNKVDEVVKYLPMKYSISESYAVLDDEKNISHYLFTVGGGNNGQADWLSYFSSIRKMFVLLNYEFSDVWLVKIENDCLDDVHNVVFCVK